MDRLAGVMDAQLSANQYLAGNTYSIADIITWPWAFLLGRMIDDDAWETFPNVKRWVDEVGQRPAIDAGRKVGLELREQQLTPEQEKARREILFNQTNDKVRAAREAAARAGR